MARLFLCGPIQAAYGSGSLMDFVLAQNLAHRHLSATEKAFLAVDVLPLHKKEAKARQKAAGGDRKSKDYNKSVSQKIDQSINDGKARSKAAKSTGSNRQYVSDAKKISGSSKALAAKWRDGGEQQHGKKQRGTKFPCCFSDCPTLRREQ